jgi:hypothetical protein
MIILSTASQMETPPMSQSHLGSSMFQADNQLWKKQDGRYVCLERHSMVLSAITCGKCFASKQALEAHRQRTGCRPAKLPSERPFSRLHGLNPDAARHVLQQSNHEAVLKYRKTAAGERAVFRARRLSNYREMALYAVPKPPMPAAPQYIPPPIFWLLADASLTAEDVRAKFGRGEIKLSHTTWSLKFHPDKVQVRFPL